MNNKNNNTKATFVKTKDKETCEALIEDGFELVDYTDGVWTFINDPKRNITFDSNKIAYSNMLCI